MSIVDRLRRHRAVRGVAQAFVVLLLVVAVFSYQHETGTQEKTGDVVETLLVDACDANDQRSLQRADLDGACELAREGDIDTAIERMDTEDPDAVRDALAAVEPPVPPVPDGSPVQGALTDLTVAAPTSCASPGFPLAGEPTP